MWLHIYVEEVLRRQPEDTLERTAWIRRQLPAEPRWALWLARLLGLVLMSAGRRLWAWGCGGAGGPHMTPPPNAAEGAIGRRAARG